jgi:hypothetical protein
MLGQSAAAIANILLNQIVMKTDWRRERNWNPTFSRRISLCYADAVPTGVRGVPFAPLRRGGRRLRDRRCGAGACRSLAVRISLRAEQSGEEAWNAEIAIRATPMQPMAESENSNLRQFRAAAALALGSCAPEKRVHPLVRSTLTPGSASCERHRQAQCVESCGRDARPPRPARGKGNIDHIARWPRHWLYCTLSALVGSYAWQRYDGSFTLPH